MRPLSNAPPTRSAAMLTLRMTIIAVTESLMLSSTYSFKKAYSCTHAAYSWNRRPLPPAADTPSLSRSPLGANCCREQMQQYPVPTANPKQLTDARESVDSPIDERSLQI